MDAREEIEKLDKRMAEIEALARSSEEACAESVAYECRRGIAAIREGLGKAHGRVVAAVGEPFGTQIEWLADHIPPKGTKLYAAPPADSAQALVDALEHDKRLLESELADFADELEVRGHSDLAESAIARLNNCKNDYRSAK